MAKQHRQIKAAKASGITRLEHTEVFDDSLLPDAYEVERLHAVDPTILEWLKGRAEKEQEFRHGSWGQRVKLVDDHNCRDHNTTRLALVIYFILVILCLGGAFELLREGHNLQGTLFGSAAFVLALAVLITKKSPTPPNAGVEQPKTNNPTK